jgi:UDP-N-acetylglucosamine 4,6-dehydratase/5-epimerase
MPERLLITGGTGFLGKRLALALKDDYEVLLGARNNKQNLQAETFTGCRTTPLDVANVESVRDAITQFRPHIVIHAAATKFVDRSENQPLECTDVNVVGSQNVARVAMDKGVDTVIGISTDKAAPPIRNIYGLSKALMERMYCALDEKSQTRFLCVRYGNVAWSTGSVLPIWKRMHDETGVVRSTGPDMTRFFFTVDEAVGLVLTGLHHVSTLHGTVLSREMKAALVRDILEVWVQQKGGRWETMEGRPGDRPYECLIGDLELEFTRRTAYDGVTHYLISFNDRVEEPLSQVVSSDNVARLSAPEIARLIQSVPAEEL